MQGLELTATWFLELHHSPHVLVLPTIPLLGRHSNFVAHSPGTGANMAAFIQRRRKCLYFLPTGMSHHLRTNPEQRPPARPSITLAHTRNISYRPSGFFFRRTTIAPRTIHRNIHHPPCSAVFPRHPPLLPPHS